MMYYFMVLNLRLLRLLRNKMYVQLFGINYWSLEDFNIVKTYTDDRANKIKNGQIEYKLYVKNEQSEPIGTFIFRLGTGQIGFAYVKDEYKNGGIGTEMIKLLTKDKINYDGSGELFVVTTKNHPFWMKMPNNSGFITPACSSVTGGGYRFNLTDKINEV